MAKAPSLNFGPKPGSPRWAEFCDWVRRFLVVETGTGLVIYRPRDASHFAWLTEPEAGAKEWNSGNAGRPVRVYRTKRAWAFIKFDGCAVAWASVRLALGMLTDADPNSEMPDPGTQTDADLVRDWGIDYALMREKMVRENDAPKRAAFLLAVERYEKRIERALTAAERAELTTKVAPKASGRRKI